MKPLISHSDGGKKDTSGYDSRQENPENPLNSTQPNASQPLSKEDTAPPDSISTETCNNIWQSDTRGQSVLEAVNIPALRKMFRKPQFTQLDGLNEYDEDFTFFSPLGHLITQDMKRAVNRTIKHLFAKSQSESPDIDSEQKPGPTGSSSSSPGTGMEDPPQKLENDDSI